MITRGYIHLHYINVLHLPIIFPRVGGSPIYPRAGMQNRLLLWQNFAKETSLAYYRLLPGSVRFTYLLKKRLIANNLFYFIE
jgi:hypothetical protein